MSHLTQWSQWLNQTTLGTVRGTACVSHLPGLDRLCPGIQALCMAWADFLQITDKSQANQLKLWELGLFPACIPVGTAWALWLQTFIRSVSTVGWTGSGSLWQRGTKVPHVWLVTLCALRMYEDVGRKKYRMSAIQDYRHWTEAWKLSDHWDPV